MINKDRIVPIQTVDLLSMYAFVLKAAGTTLTVQKAATVNGEFEIAEAPGSGSLIADEPAKSIDIASGVSAVSIYFVPAYDYSGITVNGAAATIADNGVTVDPDGYSLYLASLSSGTVTITKQTV